jgi:cold shock protein
MNLFKSIAQAFRRLFSSNETKQEGTIKFYDRKKRFGFIVSEKQELFFHATSVKSKDFRGLRDGARVNFVVTHGKKGPQADKIELV